MKLAVLVVFHVLSVNLTPTSRMNTVSEYCDCNNEVANKFENLNKVGSRGKCMEDLRDVFWSMFEDWGFGSSKTSELSNPVQLSVVRFDRCTQGACRVAAQLATRRGGGGEAGNRSGVFKSGEDSLKVAMQHTALHTDANRGRQRYKKYLE